MVSYLVLDKGTGFRPSLVCGSNIVITNPLLGLPSLEQFHSTDRILEGDRVESQGPEDIFVVVLVILGFQEMSSANAGLNMSGAVVVFRKILRVMLQ